MAAMNSFIQELRNLSSTSSASSIDSGFTGDSNVGSGRATANQQPQAQSQQQLGGAIWGNKSLWGGPPQSPPAKSSPESATGSYASKDSPPPPPTGSNPWATAVLDPSQPQQPQSPSFSPSIWENSTPKAASAAATEQPSGASPLGSIWMIPEQPEPSARSVWGESTKLLRPMEVGSGSKLSSLWTPNAATAPPAASGPNVLKSLRLAGTVGAGSGSSSSFGLGGLTTTPVTQQLFSDEFLSYLNINN